MMKAYPTLSHNVKCVRVQSSTKLLKFVGNKNIKRMFIRPNQVECVTREKIIAAVHEVLAQRGQKNINLLSAEAVSTGTYNKLLMLAITGLGSVIFKGF